MFQSVLRRAIVLLVLGLTAVSLTSLHAQTPHNGSVPLPERLDPTRFEPFVQPETYKPAGPEAKAVAVAPLRLPWARMVYQSLRDFTSWDIYSSKDDGSGEIRLTFNSKADLFPQYDRGTNRIIFATNRSGSYEIYLMNANGTGKRPLTNSNADDVRAVWSPDGGKIAFESYRDGQAEIYVMNADGSNQRRLTTGGTFNGMPEWSPDGSKIAFVSGRSGRYRIHMMNADGSSQISLSTQRYAFRPKWSPAGDKILYDGGNRDDGWLSLWTMNIDGTDQRELSVDPKGYLYDLIANGWSPDGNFVVYTHVRYVLHDGDYFWTDANVFGAASESPHYPFSLTQRGLEWMGQWQSSDIVAPQAAMREITAVSRSPIPFGSIASDAGGAEVAVVEYQMKVGTGDWESWMTNVAAGAVPFPGQAGESYAVRVRARDHAYNWSSWSQPVEVIVETELPESVIEPLPPYLRHDAPFTVHWAGSDPGGSEIVSYDVEFRLNSNEWLQWLTGYEGESAVFNPIGAAGTTYEFRSRATDQAGSVGPWSEAADAQTQLYHWGIEGHVYDNTYTPISQITMPTIPQITAVLSNSSDGRYGGYFTDGDSEYHIGWEKQGYGSLPLTRFPHGSDAQLDVVLPPANDLIQSGNFETSQLAQEWQISENQQPFAASGQGHTGNYAAQLGQEAQLADIELVDALSFPHKEFAAIDEQQRLHLIGRNDDLGQLVYVNYKAGEGWSASDPLPVAEEHPCHGRNLNAEVERNHALHVAENGNVQVVWATEGRTDRSDHYEICYVEYNQEHGWLPIEIFEFPAIPGADVYSEEAYPTIDNSGKVHLIWLSHTSGTDADTRIFYAAREVNGQWITAEGVREPFRPEHETVRLQFPQMAIDNQGTAHFVWQEYDSRDDTVNLYHRQRMITGQWSERQALTNWPEDTNFGGFDNIRLEANRAVHLIFTQAIQDGLYYMRGQYGSWSRQVFVGDHRDIYDPELIVSSAERVYITRQNDQASYYDVAIDESLAFTTYELPLPNRPSSVSLAVDDQEMLHLVYSKSGDTYYLKHEQGGNWTSPQQLETDGDFYDTTFELDRHLRPHFILSRYTRQIEGHQVGFIGPSLASETNEVALSQTVTIPADLEAPTLSFFYRLEGFANEPLNSFEVWVDDGAPQSVAEYRQLTHGWQHAWVDLSNWQGQTIDVTFKLQQAVGGVIQLVYLDEVSLGSALPDVWVDVDSVDGLAGGQATHTLHYGNRGGATAENTTLTYSLPPELSFVSASIEPVSTNPLMWDLGGLAGKQNAEPLLVTVEVDETAVSFAPLTTQATIAVSNEEPETLNNQASGTMFVQRRSYLPIIAR